MMSMIIIMLVKARIAKATGINNHLILLGISLDKTCIHICYTSTHYFIVSFPSSEEAAEYVSSFLKVVEQRFEGYCVAW